MTKESIYKVLKRAITAAHVESMDTGDAQTVILTEKGRVFRYCGCVDFHHFNSLGEFYIVAASFPERAPRSYPLPSPSPLVFSFLRKYFP